MSISPLGPHCSSVLCLLSTERWLSVGAQLGGSTSSIGSPSAMGVNMDAEKLFVVGTLAACKRILVALESSFIGSFALFLMLFL